MSAWSEYPEQLSELEAKAREVGLTVVMEEDGTYCDAMLLHGQNLITWVHYDPTEGAWGAEDHARFLTPLDHVFEFYKSQGPRLVLTAAYPRGEVPVVSAEALEAIRKLLPGSPSHVQVRHPASQPV